MSSTTITLFLTLLTLTLCAIVSGGDIAEDKLPAYFGYFDGSVHNAKDTSMDDHSSKSESVISKDMKFESEDMNNEQQTSSFVEFDEEGIGYITVSLYGLLFWQFISLSFGMCFCGGLTICYQRFLQIPSRKQIPPW